jgi:ATP-dependent helicase HepA
LLERCSHRPEHAARASASISTWDEDAEFEEYLLRLFEHCGLHIEELGRRRYFLLPGNLKSDAFPTLPNEGITVTLDRQRALEREQEAFLTWDHPMTRAALDLLLGSEAGNATFGIWESPSEKRMLLEAWVVVECVAPARLHVERFLPPVPLRIAVDHTGGDQTGDAALASAKLRRGDPASLLRNEAVKRKVLPTMLERVRELGTEASQEVIANALRAMNAALGDEISRLKDLAAMNDHVRPEEIDALVAREVELATAIRAARVRIDAVRLVWKAPAV